MNQDIIEEVVEERIAQNTKWGGPIHDDANTINDWVATLARHCGLAASDAREIDAVRFRKQMIRVAALAIAAVESADRQKRNNKGWIAGAVIRGSGV